jgi:hypothetical protein
VPDLWGYLWRNQKGQFPALFNSLKNMVSAAGFEPATHALKGHCSTN